MEAKVNLEMAYFVNFTFWQFDSWMSRITIITRAFIFNIFIMLAFINH